MSRTGAVAIEAASRISASEIRSCHRASSSSVIGQFVILSDFQKETNTELRSPDCRLATAKTLRSPQAPQWLGSTAHVSFYVGLRGPPLALRFRHRSSGEVEERLIGNRHAAIWLADTFLGFAHSQHTAAEEERLAAIVCRMPLPAGVLP